MTDTMIRLDAEATSRERAAMLALRPPMRSDDWADLGVFASFEGVRPQWAGVLGLEGIPTSDMRLILPGALSWRSLPITLQDQLLSQDGHDGAVPVGPITNIYRAPNGDGTNNIVGEGMFDTGPEGAAAQRRMAEGTKQGVSMDLTEVVLNLPDDPAGLEAILFGEAMLEIAEARIGAATLVTIPAFEGARLQILGDMGTVEPAALVASGGRLDGLSLTVVMPFSSWIADVPTVEIARPEPCHQFVFGDGECCAECGNQRDDHKMLARFTADELAALPRLHSGDRMPDESALRTGDRWLDMDAGELFSWDGSVWALIAVREEGQARFVPVELAEACAKFKSLPQAKCADCGTRYADHAGASCKTFQPSGNAKCMSCGEPSSAHGAKAAAGDTVTLQDDDGGELVVPIRAKAEPALVASGGARPPADWFAQRPYSGLHPVTIEPADEHGLRRLHGHVAAWGSCHIGFSGRCVDVPRGLDYASYQGPGVPNSVECADGTIVKAGPVIMDTVHPSLKLNASDAGAHYAHTGSLCAQGRLYEDGHGLQIQGWIMPGLSDDEIARLQASDYSPDWRPRANANGGRGVVAVLAVPVSGFNLGLVASAGLDGPVEDLAIIGSNWTPDTAEAASRAVVALARLELDIPEPLAMLAGSVEPPEVSSRKQRALARLGLADPCDCGCN